LRCLLGQITPTFSYFLLTGDMADQSRLIGQPDQQKLRAAASGQFSLQVAVRDQDRASVLVSKMILLRKHKGLSNVTILSVSVSTSTSTSTSLSTHIPAQIH
jgi:hypothetical protein